MESTTTPIEPLIDEYGTLVAESGGKQRNTDAIDWQDIESRLCNSADWTREAAQTLIRLARDYGSFMLRNAAALSIALEIDDGELGF